MLYSIIRFKKGGKNRVIKKGVTLAKAQEHCNNPKTSGLNWFDGYTKQEKAV